MDEGGCDASDADQSLSMAKELIEHTECIHVSVDVLHLMLLIPAVRRF